MALPQKLKTSPTRIVGTDIGNTIPTSIGALESALCDIFGFTADTDITASAFNLNNSGSITKALVLQAAASPVGWRFRNTTDSKEMRIVVNGSNLDFDQNTGSEAIPVWANRFRINLDTGALAGQTFSTTSSGLAPAGDGDVTHFLNANGGYTVPTVVNTTSCKLTHSLSQNLANETFTTLTFNTEQWDNGSMHSGANPTRITLPTTGKYLIQGYAGFSGGTAGTRRTLDIYFNGSTVARAEVVPNGTSGISGTVTALIDAGISPSTNYCELVAWHNSGGTLTCPPTANVFPAFSAYKIGS